jgi:hypothetical protein
MTRSVAQWSLVPWVLALGAFAVFIVAVGPFGLALATWWGVFLVVTRVEVALQRDRVSRIAIDAVFAAVAFLGGFEGGWYLLPAIGVFAVMDWRADRDTAMDPSARVRLGYLYGAASLAAVLVGVGAFAWLRAYGSVTSSVPGVVRPSFLDLAPEPWAYGGIALALIAGGLMATGLVADARNKAWGIRLLAVSLGILVVAAAMTVSGALFVAPALLLGGVSFQLLRMESPSGQSQPVRVT